MTRGVPSVVSLAEFALAIHPSKISRYLLNPTHPAGASKAAFFGRFGFSIDSPSLLADAIIEQAWSSTNIRCAPHPKGYGITVEAIGPLQGLDGRWPWILSAWSWQPDERVETPDGSSLMIARFVTAVPQPNPGRS